MKKSHGWVLPGALALAGILATPLSPQAAPPRPGDGPAARRLIQTSPERRAWMSPGQIEALLAKSHAAGHCGGFMDVTDHADKPKRQAIGLYDVTGYPEPRHQDTVEAINAGISAENIAKTVDTLSNQFKNRYYKAQTGVAAAEWIRDRYVELARGRSDVTIELFKHSFVQPSVIIRIAGQGPHAQERVILGAHEDSVNWQDGSPSVDDRAPGADDDASGIATLLEAFRALMDAGFRPDRTVEFMAYAGEELGLLGSQDIAESYAKQKVQVVGVQQFDMTLYPTANPELAIISDYVSKAMNKYTEKLLDTYVKVRWREVKCGYACSDHASWTDAGFPSAFPFETSDGDGDPYIHTTRDTLDILDPAHGAHFAKLAVAFAYELGNP